MVEARLVGVEAVDAHWHVPPLSLTVVRAFGVHHPVVAGRTDVHLAGSGHKVSREFGVEDTIHILRVEEAQGQVVVVERRAGVHFYFLGENHDVVIFVTEGVERDVHTLRVDGCTVHKDFSAIGVAACQQEIVERQCGLLGIVRLVGEVQYEACRLVERHIALHWLVNPDAWLVNRNGRHVEHGARLVPLRLALILVRLTGHAATCAEDETGIDFLVVAHVGQRVAAQTARAHLLQHLVRDFVVGSGGGVHRVDTACAVGIHGQARFARQSQREAKLLAVGLRRRVLVVDAQGKGRRDGELEVSSARPHFYGINAVFGAFLFLRIVAGILSAYFEQMLAFINKSFQYTDCSGGHLTQVVDTWVMQIARFVVAHRETFAVLDRGCTAIDGVAFHQVIRSHSQFFHLVLCQEANPPFHGIVQGTDAVTRVDFVVLGEYGGITEAVGFIVLIHRADVGGVAFFVRQLLGIVGAGAHGQQHGVAEIDEVRQQFGLDKVLRVDEGALQTWTDSHHFVADKIDGFAVGVGALGKHLHGAGGHLNGGFVA